LNIMWWKSVTQLCIINHFFYLYLSYCFPGSRPFSSLELFSTWLVKPMVSLSKFERSGGNDNPPLTHVTSSDEDSSCSGDLATTTSIAIFWGHHKCVIT
jgi:hypothetical protein